MPGVSDDLLLPHVAFVHGLGLRAEDYAAMAAAGTGLVWSPRSNVSLYGETARIALAVRQGVSIALGSDWLPTGSMNLLRELSCAAELDDQLFDDALDDEALWSMVTLNAAMIAGTDDLLGSLAVGKLADIAIFDASERELHAAVVGAGAGDVALVLRAGRPLYGDAALIQALTLPDSCDLVSVPASFDDVCGVDKRLCAADEIGQSFAQLAADNASLYPAFFCGVPEGEPSCVPERSNTLGLPDGSVDGSTLYTGVPSAGDLDGDGLPNASDLCPTVFDPVRPLDQGAQPDFDADGDGDACDVCPFVAGASCDAPDPFDRDGDGIAVPYDNCPDLANAAQDDADDDGKGDVCDACPGFANRGLEPCAHDIYAIKQGTLSLGTRVRLRDALVTAVGGGGLFVQVKATDVGYQGTPYSGMYVFFGSSTLDDAVVVGNRVELVGSVQDFFGALQLGSVESLAITSALSESLPALIATTTAEIELGGASVQPLEGVGVELTGVTVTSGFDGSFEFTVTDASSGSLGVDDLLHRLSAPSVSQTFSALRGVYALRVGVPRLLPRAEADAVP
jgi:hypothetical protein